MFYPPHVQFPYIFKVTLHTISRYEFLEIESAKLQLFACQTVLPVLYFIDSMKEMPEWRTVAQDHFFLNPRKYNTYKMKELWVA